MRAVSLACLAVLALPTAASASPELVLDMSSGRVLHAREAQAPWHPASLTKLMTAYVSLRAVAAGEATWDSPVTISSTASRAPPSRSGLAVGSRLALGDALRVLMVKSANDVAVSVAEAVGGTVPAFVARMNMESARLGMSSSRWVNPHGLDAAEQVTTARDLAVLAQAIRTDFPQADALFSIRAVTLNGVLMPNHNKAVGRVAEVDGMKTGYICASGFNVVTTAVRDGRRVAVVLLGRDAALERDARATLLAHAALATKAGGIGTLADYAGVSAARPTRRACGGRAAPDGEDTLLPSSTMAQWVRSFASLPVAVTPPVAIATLPRGAGTPTMAAPAPVPAMAAAVVQRPPSVSQPPLAYVAPAVEAIVQARAPRRF